MSNVDRVVSTKSQEKKQKLMSFGKLIRRKPESRIEEERSPSTSTPADRSNRVETRDNDAVEDDSLHNYDVASIFEQVDALVGSLMTSRTSITEVSAQAPKDSMSVCSSGKSKSSGRSKSSLNTQNIANSDIQQNQMTYTYHCFNCGEMIENITNNLASQELSYIRAGERIELSDDRSDMSLLTNFTTSLATDMIMLPKKMRARGRKVMDTSLNDDESYLLFGSIESCDGIAVDSIVQDDVSRTLSFRLEEC
jgi:hypothetical protein